MAVHYERQGFNVIEAETRQRPPLWWPWMLHNCVGATKAVLGIGAPWVWTPWQLYRYLRHRNVNLSSVRLRKADQNTKGK